MPKLSCDKVPKLRRHQNGQGVVRLSGRDYYLGPFDDPATTAKYQQLTGAWQLNGRVVPKATATEGLTVLELAASYLRFAKTYYLGREGKPNARVDVICSAVRDLTALYGDQPAANFGPLALQRVQVAWASSGKSRRYCNELLRTVKRMFKWATSRELVPAFVSQALASVEGLRRGRTEAKETKRIKPVDEKTVRLTIKKLQQVPADMVRLQLVTGMRPAEPVAIRAGVELYRDYPTAWNPTEVDQAGDHLAAIIVLRAFGELTEAEVNLAEEGPAKAIWLPLLLAMREGLARYVASLPVDDQGHLAWAVTNTTIEGGKVGAA